jgi:hypothetical protein
MHADETRRVRIVVGGRLSDRLEPLFGGLRLVHRSGRTELVGEVVDQAHLHAVLSRIRDLGLELERLSVQTTTHRRR